MSRTCEFQAEEDPVPFAENANSPQDPDSATARPEASMHRMNFPAASPRTSSPLRRFLLGAILPCLVFFIPPKFSRVASAQPQGLPSPHTTLIFFADHPIRDDQWTSLFDALHRGQTGLAATTPTLSGDVSLLRG